jgi:anti-sigma B factor antagonist
LAGGRGLHFASGWARTTGSIWLEQAKKESEKLVKLDLVDLDNQITKVVLSGRLDIEGAHAIDTKFSVIAGSRRKVIVDLSDVSFMASIGIRTIVMGAKAIANKGGKIALLNPQPNVEKVLETTGINTIIPIVKDLAAATAVVTA